MKTKKLTDPRTTWWMWRPVQERLTKWAKALLRGRKYSVILNPDEATAYHDPKERHIVASPQMFPKEPVEIQFRTTQGLLAHECGHAWFTGSWPDQDECALRNMVNQLEDQRIEDAICVLYPGVEPAIRLLGDLVYRQVKPGTARTPPEQAQACCLVWRWAARRADEEDMFCKLEMKSTEARDLWAKVRPLVEEAWEAPDTDTVIGLAREILKILGIPPDSCRTVVSIPEIGRPGSHIPTSGAVPSPMPSGPADDSPGLGSGLGDGDVPKTAAGKHLEPQPYIDLEDKARPMAARLAEALKEQRPDQRPAPHEFRGRYSFRQEVRTPDTPHLSSQDVGQAARSLALYILADRSGSMDVYQEDVRLALMMSLLAAYEAGIPIGAAYFGENDFTVLPSLITIDQTVVEVISFDANGHDREAAKALIAGFTGWSNEEYLNWGLRKAEAELRTRPERLKVLLIIHDGEPVFRSGDISDWDLSLAHLRALERTGITPIGVHLGDTNLEKLHKLFPRLVNCPDGKALPEKLGSMLRSLA